MDDYDPAEDGFRSYYAAIEAKRQLGQMGDWEDRPKMSEPPRKIDALRSRMTEHAIQSSIMRFLDLALPGSYRAFAVPNGGRRDKITGAILKREGVKAGCPDIVIVRDGGSVAFIEVKRKGGALSAAQKEWRDWCGANSVPWGVVRSVGDVQAFLTDLDVPLKARAAA